MYINGNPQSKKEIRTGLKAGHHYSVFSPGPFPCPQDGFIAVEGPHYPQPHKWYGVVEVKDGQIIRMFK